MWKKIECLVMVELEKDIKYNLLFLMVINNYYLIIILDL